MASYRELVYMVLDEVKLISDDSYYTEEHILFLLNKYRVAILKKMYESGKKQISDSNYQTLCLHLEKKDDGVCGKGTYLKSKEEVPYTIPIGNTRVFAGDYFSRDINYVSMDRMRYVGANKYTSKLTYATIGPDNHLYLKSANPNFSYLSRIKVRAIFEDAEEASNLSCDKDDITCKDSLDKHFPIEEGLIPDIIKMVMQEILGAAYRPKDSVNDASDDLSDIAYFIRRNMKKPLAKAIEGDE